MLKYLSVTIVVVLMVQGTLANSNSTAVGKDACNLPKDYGSCRGDFPMYYFDTVTKSCQVFGYGGCEGNDNRFDTREQCEKLCLGSVVRDSELPRRDWCTLNRLRTGDGRCPQYRYRCGWIDSPACSCGAAVQDIQHIISEYPLTRYTGGPPDDLIGLSDEAIMWLKSCEIDL